MRSVTFLSGLSRLIFLICASTAACTLCRRLTCVTLRRSRGRYCWPPSACARTSFVRSSRLLEPFRASDPSTSVVTHIDPEMSITNTTFEACAAPAIGGGWMR